MDASERHTTITMTMAAYVDTTRAMVACGRLFRLCKESPEEVTASAVLDVLQAAGVQWSG
jgi:hypothetical protein